MGALQALEQRVVHRALAQLRREAALDIALQADQQLRGEVGVGHRAVGAAVALQPQPVAQRAQLAAGRLSTGEKGDTWIGVSRILCRLA